MKFQVSRKFLLLSACATLFSALAFGQADTVPVVPASSVNPGEFRPFSWLMIAGDSNAAPAAAVPGPGQPACNSSNPCYYTPSTLATAYGLPPIMNRGNRGAGTTIAIVDAYYDPQIQSNLQLFSTTFGLPGIGACGSSTFTAVSQTGGPATSVGFNVGWAQEANLDVQQAHAMAPCASILLIAANSPSYVNLFTGVQYAAAHADMVSNSYGGGEFAGELAQDATLAALTVPLLFSSGDTGGAQSYPCLSPYAVCVGGTTLLTTPSAFRTAETAWYNGASVGGTGGGCSLYETKPGYQTGFSERNCGATRSSPDVAALADPYSGVPIALSPNSLSSLTAPTVVCCIGGTSLAAPLTAGILANVDSARVAAGKAKLGSNLNTLLYRAASYTPSGATVQPVPYGNSYRSFYFDVFQGGTTYPATTYLDLTTGLGVPSFSALGNYLITQAP